MRCKNEKNYSITYGYFLGVSLCACGGNTNNSEYDEEKQLKEQIEALEDEYDGAKQNADQFKQDVDDYYDALDDLEKYK